MLHRSLRQFCLRTPVLCTEPQTNPAVTVYLPSSQVFSIGEESTLSTSTWWPRVADLARPRLHTNIHSHWNPFGSHTHGGPSAWCLPGSCGMKQPHSQAPCVS